MSIQLSRQSNRSVKCITARNFNDIMIRMSDVLILCCGLWALFVVVMWCWVMACRESGQGWQDGCGLLLYCPWWSCISDGPSLVPLKRAEVSLPSESLMVIAQDFFFLLREAWFISIFLSGQESGQIWNSALLLSLQIWARTNLLL